MTLSASTLVLNRHWMPVHVTTVRQALILAYAGRAHIVCPETYTPHTFDDWLNREIADGARSIQSLHFKIQAPEVLVLSSYAKVPPRGVVFNRFNLSRRDGNACQYCGARLPLDKLTIDHVVPQSRGGETSWENCVLACMRCNNRKGSRTPAEANMKLSRLPERPDWSPRYAAYARSNRPGSWSRFIPAAQLVACELT
jgi:5-methylcytosine-specific restriction endonuclease McrA